MSTVRFLDHYNGVERLRKIAKAFRKAATIAEDQITTSNPDADPKMMLEAHQDAVNARKCALRWEMAADENESAILKSIAGEAESE